MFDLIKNMKLIFQAQVSAQCPMMPGQSMHGTREAEDVGNDRFFLHIKSTFCGCIHTISTRVESYVLASRIK